MWFWWRLDNAAAETLRILLEVYGNSTPNEKESLQWHRYFKSRRISTGDNNSDEPEKEVSMTLSCEEQQFFGCPREKIFHANHLTRQKAAEETGIFTDL
jgi:hypothetical protein